MRAGLHPLLALLLGPPAWLYEGVVRLRNRRYDREGASVRAELPVLSVGNLTVGGTGKTPMVAWLARHLIGMGRRPAVVSRGYGGNAGKGPLVVSRGKGPICAAGHCGDEPHFLAQALAGVIVIVGSDRPAGAARARRLGADVIVLDDGFQHRRLARDLDIVLVDAHDPFGGDRLLPAGRLREPIGGVGRADLVVITRSDGLESSRDIESIIREHNPESPILRSTHRPLGFFSIGGASIERPRRAVAFCGIAAPGEFRRDLETAGVELASFVPFRDHHPYTAEELQKLRRTAEREDATVVTTEKDAARIGDETAAGELPGLACLRIETVMLDPAPLIHALERVVGSPS